MFQRFQMIRNFDQYQKLQEEQTKFSALIFHKQDLFILTRENQAQAHQVIQSRSIKQKNTLFQTTFSFHMNNQHVFAFKKYFEKFLEKCLPNLKKLQINTLLAQIFEKQGAQFAQESSINNLITKDSRLFQLKQKKQFLTDLYYQQKFGEFLTVICNSIHPQLALDLIYIANLFWQVYIPKQQIGLKEEQIKKIVEQIIDSLNTQNYLQKLQYLNLKKSHIQLQVSQQQLKINLKQFIRKFGITIICVLEEYFKNPFFKDQEQQTFLKRSLNFKDISNDQFSDDQDQINFCSKKKRKF